MNYQQVNDSRAELLTILKFGLKSVNGRTCVTDFLQKQPLKAGKIRLVATGKAAECMCLAAMDVLGEKIQSGLLITKHEHVHELNDSRITVIESDHPIPSGRSLQAGDKLIEFLQEGDEDELVLVLISGGASALVECLPEGCSLEQLQQLNQWLVSNPWSIQQINKVRQSISLLKAGRALNYLNAKQALQLTISDVESNDLSIIGSGLFVEASNSLIQETEVPDWIRPIQEKVLQHDARVKPHPKAYIEHYIVADNTHARQAMQQAALEMKLKLICNAELFCDVTEASEKIIDALISGPAGVYIWGGETVVNLPQQTGQGGRCQALALQVAKGISVLSSPIVFLACGSDGTDGPGDVAGAIVDNYTIQRGESLDLMVDEELKAANSGYYLEQTGDLIDTGPTGTNVMDLMLAIKLEA